MSLIWFTLRLSAARLTREEREEMSLIWFPSRSSSVRLVQYSRPERSLISLSRADSVVRLASSAVIISSPTGLPRASLMAASRLPSGKIVLGPAQPTGIATKTRRERVTANILNRFISYSKIGLFGHY